MLNKLLIILFFLPVISATICSDSFPFTNNVIQICGYCHENNGSICNSARLCNFTIYYSNNSEYIRNVTGVNNGDGTVTYNITQNITGGNLTNGYYFGEMYCGIRSRSKLSFNVYTPTSSGGGGGSGGGGYVYQEYNNTQELDEIIEKLSIKEKNKIPKDITVYWEWIANHLTKQYPALGKFLTILLLIIFIFSYDIYKYVRKKKWKKEKKEEENA